MMFESGRIVLPLVGFTVGLLLWGGSAPAAQRVVPGLTDRGNRVEGLARLPISGGERPGLDLVSFTGFVQPFSDTESVVLRVRFFVPTPDAEVRIVAQELSADLFYRMESKRANWPAQSWSVFTPWPTSDVVLPSKVQPTNIGVVVFLAEGPEGRANIAPAFVEHGDARATLTRYRVQLRPVRATFSAVDYRLERLGDRPAEVVSDTMSIVRPEQRPFRLDLDASSLADGRYLLTVIGYVKDSSSAKVTRQYEFEHRRLPS